MWTDYVYKEILWSLAYLAFCRDGRCCLICGQNLGLFRCEVIQIKMISHPSVPYYSYLSVFIDPPQEMGVVISYPGIANQSFVCMIASGAELPKDSCILFLSAKDTFWSGIQLSSLVLVISDPTLPYSWDSRSFTCISNYIKKNFNLIIKHYPDFLLAILFGNAIQWKTL